MRQDLILIGVKFTISTFDIFSNSYMYCMELIYQCSIQIPELYIFCFLKDISASRILLIHFTVNILKLKPIESMWITISTFSQQLRNVDCHSFLQATSKLITNREYNSTSLKKYWSYKQGTSGLEALPWYILKSTLTSA